MGATTSRCEEAEAEPVQEVRSAVRCLRLQVSISFLPVSFAVQAGNSKKEALVGRPNLPVPLPIFRLRSKSPLPRSRRSPPPTSRCAPAPRVNALSQNPAIEALPSPRLFFPSRACTQRHSPLCLTFVLPRLHRSKPRLSTPASPRRIKRSTATLVTTSSTSACPCPGGRRRHAHKSRCSLLVTKELCSNKYLSARSPHLLFIVSGAKRRRVRTTKSARSMPSTTALCALLTG